jgi:hydroxymethylpyrimidine/phosphomethylpyrimidine kinase
VQNQTTPLILTFGVSDPVGAIGVQADVATFAALGCHGLSVITGLLVADSARVEDSQPVDADWVADQGRVLLEDMHVAAIKIGALATLSQVSVVAEIVSDYPDVPLILDPYLSALPDSGLHDDDMIEVLRQILIPQATVLLLSQVELARMAETWRDGGGDGDMAAADAEELLHAGCKYLLLKCAASSRGDGAICNTLYGAEGQIGEFQWQHLPGPFVGAGSTLSAALTALLARGLPVHEAVAAAQDFTAGALQHAQRLGMGKLVPKRFYGYQPPPSRTAPPEESTPL